MIIDGVKVFADPITFSTQELENYVNFVRTRIDEPENLSQIKVILCDDGKCDVSYKVKNIPFERIRRITGYLTGDLKTWNDSKRSEESERVRHL